MGKLVQSKTEPTFTSIIQRPTSGPLLRLYSLNRSFICIFFSNNETLVRSFQAADTPTQSQWILSASAVLKIPVPLKRLLQGIKVIERFQALLPKSPPSGPQHDTPEQIPSYLRKKKCSLLKCIIYSILGFFRTFSTSVLQIFSVQTFTGGNSSGDFTKDLLHGEFI